MSLVHRVLGFDKVTEALVHEAVVPDAFVQQARSLAGAPADPGEAPGGFLLTPAAAYGLSMLLRRPLNPDRFDWILEPAESAGRAVDIPLTRFEERGMVEG